MSKFEELCLIYAASRKHWIENKHSCQAFADFLIHRMSLYFECPIETGNMEFDPDGCLHIPASMTLYQNPQNPKNCDCEQINLALVLRRKGEAFSVTVLNYGSSYTIPRDNLNKLDEIYEVIENKIKQKYENKIKALIEADDFVESDDMPF